MKVRGAEWHAEEAARYGRKAKGILLDYIDEVGPVEPVESYIVDEIVAHATKAGHFAILAMDMKDAAQAPVRQILANAEDQRLRQAFTPRCSYRRVTEEKRPDGSVQQVAGDPCGGKLKPVTRRRVLTGGECAICGRFYPVPKEPETVLRDAIEAGASS